MLDRHNINYEETFTNFCDESDQHLSEKWLVNILDNPIEDLVIFC